MTRRLLSGYGSYNNRQVAQPITYFDVMDMATRCSNLINFQWKKRVEYEEFASIVSIDPVTSHSILSHLSDWAPKEVIPWRTISLRKAVT